MLKIACQKCGEECEISGYISSGIQGPSLISIDTYLEVENSEVAGEIQFNCQRCGNMAYLSV